MRKYNHPRLKLGKRAARHDLRTLKLAKYLAPSLPAPPDELDYTKKISVLPVYLNQTIGDCSIAAPAHMIQAWTANEGAETDPTDQDVLKAYEDVGGYNPNDPSTDNGCAMLDVLNYWRQTGIGGHKILAYAAVNWSNPTEVRQAVWLFGGLYIGLALPLSAQHPAWHGIFGRNIWDVPASGPVGDGSWGSWGGHAICLEGWDGNGYSGITWGSNYIITQNFINTYCDEAFAVLSGDWLGADNKCPVGFNLDELQADLAAL